MWYQLRVIIKATRFRAFQFALISNRQIFLIESLELRIVRDEIG